MSGKREREALRQVARIIVGGRILAGDPASVRLGIILAIEDVIRDAGYGADLGVDTGADPAPSATERRTVADTDGR